MHIWVCLSCWLKIIKINSTKFPHGILIFNIVSHFIFQAFETPETHSSCFSFLRQYAEESFSKAACLVTAKNIIAYPQVTFDFLMH